MALWHECERVGNWFFRRRSYLPLLLIIVFLLALHDLAQVPGRPVPGRAWEIFCLGISFLGLFVRLLTVGFVPRGTSGRNTRSQVADVLNTSGMYAMVRHPLYLGNFLMWLGIALFFRVWWLALIFCLVFWLYYEKIMYAEEAFLQDKFGDAFQTWAAATPLFIPRLSRWQAPTLKFSWRSALKREYASFFAMISVFFTLHLLSRLYLQRTLSIDRLWLAIFLLSLVFYGTVRYLKKRTNLLADDR